MFTDVRSNLVSGNSWDGIAVQFANNTFSNSVQANWIGIDASGTNALPNGEDGLVLTGPSGALVQENIISGNRRNGIRLDGAYNEYPSVVRRNVIGLDRSGVNALPNGEYGISVFQVNALTIGG